MGVSLLSMFICMIHAEVFIDDDYNYRINIPEGSIVNHFPHKNFNLNFILPDSSATFYIYVLDVNEIPHGEYESDDIHYSYKENYIENLDKEAFNVGENKIEDKVNTWIVGSVRRYELGNGRQAITYTYFDDENPHVVAVFGYDLDRPIVKKTLESFRTSSIVFTGKAYAVYVIGLILLVVILALLGEYIKNGMIAGTFFILMFVAIFLLEAIGLINIPGYIWQWI